MGWFNPKLEPGERVVLRHWPTRLAYGLAGAIAALDTGLFLAVFWYVKQTDALGERELTVAILVAAVIVLAPVPLFVRSARLAVVTNRRILARNGIFWSKPKQIRLHEIEEVRLRGKRVDIRGGGQTMDFPCPRFLARSLIKALGREPAEAAT